MKPMCECAKLFQLCLTLCDPMNHQAPLFIGFWSLTRQEFLTHLGA